MARRKHKRGRLSRFRMYVLSRPPVLAVLALAVSWVLRLWLRTVQYRFWTDYECAPRWVPRPAIYVFWHEMLLFPAHTHARYNVATLISQHRDGELLAQTLRRLGGEAVRGSTERGGVEALLRLLDLSRSMHLAIAPDGPKGPRRVVQSGVVFLASWTGMPIVPMGLAYRRCLRARSWDRMALPLPGTAGRGIIGSPLRVPAGISREEIQRHVRQLQEALDSLQARAERVAAGLEPDVPYSLEEATGPVPPAPLRGRTIDQLP